MDEFIVIKVMNEATLRLKKSKNEDFSINDKIKQLLQDEAIFFKIKKLPTDSLKFSGAEVTL